MDLEEKLSSDLRKELRKRLSLIRLAKTGFFKKAAIPDEGVSKEILLHRAVLDKALIDLFSTHEEIRGEVEEWLDLDNPDFIDACERAVLPKEEVLETFLAFKKLLRGKNARFKKFGEKV